jgi:hypothetical protein
VGGVEGVCGGRKSLRNLGGGGSFTAKVRLALSWAGGEPGSSGWIRWQIARTAACDGVNGLEGKMLVVKESSRSQNGPQSQQ